MSKILTTLTVLMFLLGVSLHELKAQNNYQINDTATFVNGNKIENPLKILTQLSYSNSCNFGRGILINDNITDLPDQAFVNKLIITTSFLVTGIIFLSNDIFVYPVYSFTNKYTPYSGKIINGTNWVFGLRKTFPHSALEYGVSYNKSNLVNEWIYNNNIYSYSEKAEQWGFHINFVQQVFYNKTPEWMKIYCGSSVNILDNFGPGIGGIIGTEIKLLKRLKFDIRYEYTTTTNRIMAGLIFTYQKKYLWQKK